MNILLVNEAGCFAPGIIALAKALSTRHRVVIVAPLQSHYKSGHRLTTGAYPLRVKQYFVLNKIKIFSVNGTPCDCVTLALDKILRSKPDLIVSGFCDYYNRGEALYSSGVVSAAIEGTIQGIPSIALSTKTSDSSNEKSFQPIANSFAKNLHFFMKNMPVNTTLNINYPDNFSPKKIVCTHLTHDTIDNKYQPEVNSFGNTFYWLNIPQLGFPLPVLEQKGDLYWIKRGYTTVTPLKLNLTNDSAIHTVESAGITL